MPTVQANGINVYYEIHGEGEPLLLISGLASDHTLYRGVLAQLAARYQVIVFDNRGVGYTDKPNIPYSIDMMADDTAGLLNALGIARAHVLGTSMGGRIAIALALKHPELVKSLILVSTTARSISRGWLSRQLLNVQLVIPALQAVGGRHPQPYYALVRQRTASGSYDAVERLHEIHVPTIILHGKQDKRAPYQLAEETHAGIKGSELIAFNGGHLFFIFRPQQFLDAVMKFLEAQTIPQN